PVARLSERHIPAAQPQIPVQPPAAPKSAESSGTAAAIREPVHGAERAGDSAWQRRDAAPPQEEPRAPQMARVEAPPAEPPAVPAGPASPRLDGLPFATQVVHVGDSMSSIAVRKYGQ